MYRGIYCMCVLHRETPRRSGWGMVLALAWPSSNGGLGCGQFLLARRCGLSVGATGRGRAHPRARPRVKAQGTKSLAICLRPSCQTPFPGDSPMQPRERTNEAVLLARYPHTRGAITQDGGGGCDRCLRGARFFPDLNSPRSVWNRS